MGYEDKLFSTSTVHTIDIRMEDWDEFIEGCESEEYSPCTVVIDDETYQNVAIRAKGNTSLTQVKAYGNDRYSFSFFLIIGHSIGLELCHVKLFSIAAATA